MKNSTTKTIIGVDARPTPTNQMKSTKSQPQTLPISQTYMEKASKMIEDEAGNFRSKENLVMRGDDVFNFVQREVPPMIHTLLNSANINKDEVDWYMFHQPNKFMLNKLADAIGIPKEKMPTNIVENFGNSSGVTVPLNISYNLGETLIKETKKICLAGFGVGLTWSSILMNIGTLKFNKVITI